MKNQMSETSHSGDRSPKSRLALRWGENTHTILKTHTFLTIDCRYERTYVYHWIVTAQDPPFSSGRNTIPPILGTERVSNFRIKSYVSCLEMRYVPNKSEPSPKFPAPFLVNHETSKVAADSPPQKQCV